MKGRRGDKKKVHPGSSSHVNRGAVIAPPNVESNSSPVRLITLLTDFGAADYFTGSMKGVILSINPHATIVDITHDIPPQDIEAAAFTLLAAYRSFPRETIHVAVVDPGVGSARLPILALAKNQFFIGPDNGIFSYVLDSEPDHRVFRLSNTRFFRNPVSSTFHGRDLFAPVAAALSAGVQPRQLGPQINDCVRLAPLAAEEIKPGKLSGRIIHIDRFGNCITNITPNSLPFELRSGQASLTLNGKIVRSFREFFAEENGGRAELFGIWGSAGFLEIAARNKSAAKILKAKRGQKVVMVFDLRD